jgi:glucuronate isomerase
MKPAVLVARAVFPEVVERLRLHFEVEDNPDDLALVRSVEELNAARNWTMQLHIGAERNNSQRLFEKLGRDVGCDSMADVNHAFAVRRNPDFALRRRGHHSEYRQAIGH